MLATFGNGKVEIKITKTTTNREGKKTTSYIKEAGKVPDSFTPEAGAILYLTGGEPGFGGLHILETNSTANSFYLKPTVGNKTQGVKVRVRKTGSK